MITATTPNRRNNQFSVNGKFLYSFSYINSELNYEKIEARKLSATINLIKTSISW